MKSTSDSLYRKFLIANRALLEDRIQEEEVAFYKIMKNLVFGTNRSVFTAMVGKEQEGVEKWMPGKPLNRINIRATVGNLLPNRTVDSLFINTYRDDRELAVYLLSDYGAEMFPSQFLTGVPDPLKTKMTGSLMAQAFIRSIAREYDCQLRHISFSPVSMPLSVDVKNRSMAQFFRPLEVPLPETFDPRSAFSFFFRKNIRHSVIFLLSHEEFFRFPGRAELLRDLKSLSLTNDLVFFCFCTDIVSDLENSSGPVEVFWPGGGALVKTEAEKRNAADKLLAARIQEFSILEEAGIRVCQLTVGKENWVQDMVDFFRKRLVLK